ncbi:MAG: DUF885 family protein [Gammaproteobacteria bacterium]|nr:DUF885 family protein [Gammaproteobacteria bacterium]
MPVYNDLIDLYYRTWFRFHPEVAVDLGIEGYSELLTPYDDDDIGALNALHEKLINALSELNTDSLDMDQQIDLDLMYGQALIESKQLLDQDWRMRDPTRFLPINAIYQLTIRPVRDRGAALRARLQAIPGYLRGAKQYLLSEPESIPPLWLEAAITEAEEGVKYLRGLHQNSILQRFRLDKELDAAAQAVQTYADFLMRDIGNRAQGDVACGRDIFELLLTHRHGLDISADHLRAFGERLFAEVAAQLREVTRQLQGDENVAALMTRIQAQYRPTQPLLSLYKEQMQAAQDFVKTKHLVSIPAQQHLHVVETPAFLRHQIPFAAYWNPMPTDPAQTGYYYVTPPQDEASWGEHNRVSLQHTCVHEAWPGHHLQFVTANNRTVSRSLPRLINISATMYEGWALYSEQLMAEQGFLRQPESQFILLKDRLWRALRVLLDVDLHVHSQNIAAAAKTMYQHLGFSQAQALGELTWYTQAPTVPMGYATGWALIDTARTRLQAISPQFDLCQFHDHLLSAGSIGLPWVIRRVFGEPLWSSVRQSVLKPA